MSDQVLVEHVSSLSTSNSATWSMCGLPALPHDPVHESDEDAIIACASLMPLIDACLLMFHILEVHTCPAMSSVMVSATIVMHLCIAQVLSASITWFLALPFAYKRHFHGKHAIMSLCLNEYVALIAVSLATRGCASFPRVRM